MQQTKKRSRGILASAPGALRLLAIWCSGLFGFPAAAAVKSPLSPEDSLAHLRVDSSLAVELVACEPEVVDPVAMRFDEQGRLWVVEMRDYPHGPKPGEPPLSRIKVLTDVDGDGRFETARVFADRLLFPTGLQPWRGGVIVTLAGEVVYLKDTDGDGRADLRETWYRGFVQENPQLRANHPRLALDNRVYVANGLLGGVIVDPRRGDAQPLSISGLDFAFDPHSGACEAVAGNGQFGLTFNDFGDRFVCNNRAPLDQIVLENRYVARNPFLAVPALIANVARGGDQSRIFPLTAAWTTSNLHAGQFTAACGIDVYRGDRLPGEYRGNAFVCEPTGSLVHREVLQPDGVTFDARPASDEREFLASTDPWFRPVNLESGPDGALYVVDMYRAVIEHPQFMPNELQNRPDLREGDDRGRIYRIVPVGQTPRPSAPNLADAQSDQLVELLAHPNAWLRETAARLLSERRDASVAGPLEGMARGSTSSLGRVRALWVLAGLERLSNATLEHALDDSDPLVREQACRLAETRIAASEELCDRVLRLADDSDPRVRFRAALALGSVANARAASALARIGLVGAADAWTRRAVACALPEQTADILESLVSMLSGRELQFDAVELTLARELAVVVGSRQDPADIARLLQPPQTSAETASPVVREALLLGLAQGVERRGGKLMALVRGLSASHPAIEAQMQKSFDMARGEALDEKVSEAVRGQKIDLLRFDVSPAAAEALLQIAGNDDSQTLRLRATTALVMHSGPLVGTELLENFARQSPALRRAIFDVLLADVSRAGLLLDAVESGRIARAELDTARENRLREHADVEVRKRAQTILTVSVPADRKIVLADYQAALELPADSRAGKDLFRQHCSVCHRIGDIGVDVAPNISDSRIKTPEQLLVDILSPNQAIDNNYVSYTVATRDGTVQTGILAAETATSITLRQAENKSIDILRSDVEMLRSNGVSLMPEGFEKHLSRQQVADLISFVKNWRYLDAAADAGKPK